MKNDFDKQIKNLLEDSTASNAGFEWDRKAVWDKIESKQETKIIPFKKWISHAAAVVIGILLCLPFLFRSEKETVKNVVITKTAPSVQTISDTVFIVQNAKQSTKQQHSPTAITKQTTLPENIANTTLQSKKEAQTSNILQESHPDQMVATTEISRPKIKVLHLSDIENENAVPRIKRSENYALFNKINFPARMDDKSETISMIVDNQFFNSKK